MQDPRDLLVAWLHDPPDKAFAIRGHEARAARYLTVALGIEIAREEIKGHAGDQRASATERLPVPDWKAADQATVVDSEAMVVHHPLSAESNRSCGIPLPDSIEETRLSAAIERLVDGVDDTEKRLWLLWRRLPEDLEREAPGFALLPADTRIPDHSIWQHLDTAAAMHVAYTSRHAPAFLSFSIGPVQPFIASARSVRDLWSGSMLLSWLVFRAMIPILEELGPASIVYPSIRGNPLLDLWLRRARGLKDRLDLPPKAARMIPCLPNRFLALVPGHDAQSFAQRIEASARHAWSTVAEAIHQRLSGPLGALDPEWDRHWQRPIDDQFDFRTIVLPWDESSDETLSLCLTGAATFGEAFPQTQRVRALADAIPESDRPPGHSRIVGQWQHRLELLGRIAESDKRFREAPRAADVIPEEIVPPMCSLTGATEQVGPPTLAEAAAFWEGASEDVRVGGVRLRPRERLGPVALVKRFCGPVHFADELEFDDARALRFDDTATIAAALWLREAQERDPRFRELYQATRDDGSWSGQWLHAASSPVEEEDDEACPTELAAAIERLRGANQLGPPPTYYAILMIDGDEMGKWLQGRKSPRIEELFHPQLRDYFQQHTGSPEGLQSRRPVTPAFHASLSQALANFALHFVPEIVRKYRGTLIYAGGDDVLALLPVRTALPCAAELEATYRQEWKRDSTGAIRMLMGRRATVSAGVAIVHHKSSLRWALEQARQAERAAKSAGRNLLQLTAARRSGELTSALCPWPFLPVVSQWIEVFTQGASDRWTYQLRRLLESVGELPDDACVSLLRRQIARAEKETRQLFGKDHDASEVLAEQFDQFRRELDPLPNAPVPFRDFVMLCQTASFLARGTD